MLDFLVTKEVRERLSRLEVPFGSLGVDPLGVSRNALGRFYSMLAGMYRRFFNVDVTGLEQIPDGPAILIGNHSGALPFDGGMVVASLFFDHQPPRLVHAMVEKMFSKWPWVSFWFNRVGQFSGLPEHAHQVLRAGRLLLVFPEGARGTGKLYKDRYELVRFGTGFVRIALQAGVPIVPFAFVGAEEAFPTVYHNKTLARLIGAPYWPVPPWIIPLPRPYDCQLKYGTPLYFEGDGSESDEVIDEYVQTVRQAITELINGLRADPHEGTLSRLVRGRQPVREGEDT